MWGIECFSYSIHDKTPSKAFNIPERAEVFCFIVFMRRKMDNALLIPWTFSFPRFE